MNAAERKIADFLELAGIKYIFENPMLIEHDLHGKKFMRIYYPDFFLSEYGVILEFWGMHEDKEYAKVMDKKKEVYYHNWIFVINVYNLEGNWQEYILKKLEEVTKHRSLVLKKSYDKFKTIPADVIKAAQGPDPRKAQRQKAREAEQEIDAKGNVVFKKNTTKAPARPTTRTPNNRNSTPRSTATRRGSNRPNTRTNSRPVPGQTRKTTALRKTSTTSSSKPPVKKPVVVAPVAKKVETKKEVAKTTNVETNSESKQTRKQMPG